MNKKSYVLIAMLMKILTLMMQLLLQTSGTHSIMTVLLLLTVGASLDLWHLFALVQHRVTMRSSLQIGDYSSSQAVGRNQLRKQKQQRDNVKRMKDGAVCGSKDQQQRDDRRTSAGNTKLLAEMKHDHTL
jgi:hypothetical protein